MFKNYLLMAWRNILSKKVFSFIKICGLAISMSVCLLIIVILNGQLNFDTFHPNAKRIYLINTSVTHRNNTIERVATAPYPLSDVLDKNPIIEKVVNVDRDFITDVLHGQDKLLLKGMFTDPSFFKTFGFVMLMGDRQPRQRRFCLQITIKVQKIVTINHRNVWFYVIPVNLIVPVCLVISR